MEQTSLSLPDMGSAINGAYTTISSQVENLIALYTRAGDTESVMRLQSFAGLIDMNFEFIVSVGNDVVTTFDQMVETAQTHQQYKQQFEDSQRLRENEAEKIVQIVDAHEKTLKYNGELLKKNQALQSENAETHRLKKQVKRLEESLTSKDAEITQLKQKLQTSQSKVHTSVNLLAKGISLMKFVREAMIFDGLAVELTFHYDNQAYYAYRRPGLPTDWTNVMDTPLSPLHKYYWRIETNSGYHYDVLPKADGGIAIAKPKALPAPIKKKLEEEFKITTEFTAHKEDLSLREDKLNNLLKDLDFSLLDCQVYLTQAEKSITPLKTNKKNKR